MDEDEDEDEDEDFADMVELACGHVLLSRTRKRDGGEMMMGKGGGGGGGGGGGFGLSGWSSDYGGGGGSLSIFEATRCPVCECGAGMRADNGGARGEEEEGHLGWGGEGVLRDAGRDVVVVGGRRGVGSLDGRVGNGDEEGEEEEEECEDGKLIGLDADERADASFGEGLMGVGRWAKRALSVVGGGGASGGFVGA